VVDVQAVEREGMRPRESGEQVEQDDRVDAAREGEGQARAGRDVPAQFAADPRSEIT
jgi:hypothetical protein